MLQPKTRLLAALTSAVVAIGIFSASAGATSTKPVDKPSHGKSDCKCPKGTKDPNYCEVGDDHGDDHGHGGGHGHGSGHGHGRGDDRGGRRGGRS